MGCFVGVSVSKPGLQYIFACLVCNVCNLVDLTSAVSEKMIYLLRLA